jgi:hypothetical protein
VEEPEASSAAPHWSWTRLLKRVFALDLAICPFCHQGTLRIIAAITQGRSSERSSAMAFDWVA